MDAKTNIKARLPSRHVTEGPERAPHRSYLYAMGLTAEQIHQPLVGVASCWNEAAPCNISLMRQAQAVKKGVAAAQGTPREFCTITVTTASRWPWRHEGLAAFARVHRRFGRADHARPRLRRARRPRRLRQVAPWHDDGDVPAQCAVDLHLWRSILPGNFRGQVVTVQDMFEAVGRHSVGSLSTRTSTRWSRCLPVGRGLWRPVHRQHHGDRSEAIGLALPYSAGAPAPYEIRDKFCMAAGEQVMELIRMNLRPRDIVTRKALENAAAVVAASGGSTNAALHLPAIAHECGIEFTLFDVPRSSKRHRMSRI